MSRIPAHLSHDPFRPDQREPERRLELLRHAEWLLRRAQQEHQAGNYAVRDRLVTASQWWIFQVWSNPGGEP